MEAAYSAAYWTAYSAAVAAASLVGCWPALGATDPTTPGAGAIVMGITRSLAIPKTILDQIYSPRWLNPKGEGGRTLQRQFGSHNSEDTFGWQRRCYRFRVDTSGDADPTTKSTWWSSKWLLKQILIELNWCLLSWNVSVLVGALLVLAVNDDVLIGGLHCHFIGTELRHVNHHLTSTKKKKNFHRGRLESCERVGQPGKSSHHLWRWRWVFRVRFPYDGWASSFPFLSYDPSCSLLPYSSAPSSIWGLHSMANKSLRTGSDQLKRSMEGSTLF